MKSILSLAAGLCLVAVPRVSLAWDGDASQELFARGVAPLLSNYCADCHGDDQPEAGLAIAKYPQPAKVIADHEVWQKVLKVVQRQQMPPPDEKQPPAEEIASFLELVRGELARFDCSDKIYPGRVTIRRLNRIEYDNTIRDLLGIDFRPARDFPSDDVGAGFDNIADVLSISPILIEKYLAAAAEIVRRALADEQARAHIYVCDPRQVDGEQVADCYRDIVKTFASRAYRRPVTLSELERLLALGKSALERGASAEEALSVALQAILVSPHFLFRIEHDPAPEDAGGVRRLSDFELATRLSYFLWSSMPDERLFELARKQKLSLPHVLPGEVKRMLADTKSEALVKNFAGQWLQLRDLASVTPDRELFPAFDQTLREAMRRETEMFFDSIIRQDRSVLELLDADYSFLNERLARHYGIEGVRGEHFRRVALNDQRRGVLTHGSILLLTSNPTRTSPVKRGKWILDNFLDDPPPPPLPGVMELEDQLELVGSLREKMEQHRADPACAVCHRQMDALGFGLDNFDAIGGWRERDGRFPIDPAGTLPGNLSFRGPLQLMRVLKENKHEDFCRCLSKKMLTYALGRQLQPFDLCATNTVLKELASADYKFSALITAIVTSIPFTMRGAHGAQP